MSAQKSVHSKQSLEIRCYYFCLFISQIAVQHAFSSGTEVVTNTVTCSRDNMLSISETKLNCVLHTGELGYDGPLYDIFVHMTDDMLGPSPMNIKYLSYVYDGFCI